LSYLPADASKSPDSRRATFRAAALNADGRERGGTALSLSVPSGPELPSTARPPSLSDVTRWGAMDTRRGRRETPNASDVAPERRDSPRILALTESAFSRTTPESKRMLTRCFIEIPTGGRARVGTLVAVVHVERLRQTSFLRKVYILSVRPAMFSSHGEQLGHDCWHPRWAVAVPLMGIREGWLKGFRRSA
jgi:hypothetical protein